MPSKSKYVVGGIIGAVILVSLFFIPTNEFFGIRSYNPESPPPIVVLSNNPDDFEIEPAKCAVESDKVEFQFDVKNNLDEDYRLEIHLVLNDKNERNLSKEAILVEAHAGQTATINHQAPFNPDFVTCQIELKRSEKIE